MEEGRREGRILLRLSHCPRPLLGFSGARSLSHFTAQWGLQTWHHYVPRGYPPPTLLHFSPFPPSVLSLFVSYPSLSLSLSLAQPISPLTPPPPLLSFPGASLPSRVGQQSRRQALLSRHSHLTQCGTTWLITNPISGALCASKGCSVLLSHFIRAITGHFIFCLRPNVLSDTLNTSGAVRGDSRGS